MNLSGLIRSCAEKRSALNGKSVHARLIVSGSDPVVRTNNHLLVMYFKLGERDYAHKVFGTMPERNVVTWSVLISGYYRMGCSEMALNCFKSMVVKDGNGIAPNDYSYVAAVSACAELGNLRNGKEIHGRVFRMGNDICCHVSNSLIHLYGKCGLFRSARLILDSMPEINVVSCVSLMYGYLQSAENEEALLIFLKLLRMGIEMNEFAYVSVLSACAALKRIEVGTQVQCLAVKSGIRMDQFAVSSLVNLYAKCGEFTLAGRALREGDGQNIVAWTALIGGCVQRGNCKEALHIFDKMLSQGLNPNEQTLVSVLGALGELPETRSGLQLHCLVVKAGFGSCNFVSNALIDFYAKSDCLDASFAVFEGIDRPSIINWSSLIAGCVASNRHEDAIELIKMMQFQGFSPNPYTCSSILKLCSSLAATEWGKQTHCCVIKPGLDTSVVIGGALADMYAKCGHLGYSQKVFDALPSKNLIIWNAMVVGYANHGLGKEALDLFEIMLEKEEIRPNNVTFVGVLLSCAHIGDLEKSLYYFGLMIKDFGITPSVDHIACVVSLFARKGQMQGACEFMSRFSTEPCKVVWRCVLSGCLAYKDLELAEYCVQQILACDPCDCSALVLLSNVYADSGMWSDVSRIRKLMEDKTMKKEPGYSRAGS